MVKYIRGKTKDHPESILIAFKPSVKYSVFFPIFTEIITLGDFSVNINDDGCTYITVYSRDKNGNNNNQEILEEDANMLKKMLLDGLL